MTIAETERVLELASQEELASLYFALLQYPEEHPDAPIEDQQAWLHMVVMIEAEAERRKVEPLWRKAKRFTVRNAGEIGKCAAAAAVGAFLGIELTD